MAIVTLQNTQLRLVLSPDIGASIVAFEWKPADSADWLPLMRPTPADALTSANSGLMASFNLVPWSNRISGASFPFEGTTYHLRANTPQGFAIHGDVRQRAWKVIEEHPDQVLCSLDSRDYSDINFPFPFETRLQYSLQDKQLITAISLRNVGAGRMPAGFGFHPYFNRAYGGIGGDEVQLALSVSGVYPPMPGMMAQAIPQSNLRQGSDRRTALLGVPSLMDFSVPTAIGQRDIDHCFGGWDGHATISYPSVGVQLQIDCDPVFEHVIIYTPPGRPFFAVEPVTHANDGFNLLAQGYEGTGIRILQPGESIHGRFGLRVLS